MKPKFFHILILLVLVSLIASACQTKTPAPTTAPQATDAPVKAVETEKPKEPTQRYVMITNLTGHPFWVPIRQGAQDAADELGVKFEFTGPVEWDVAAQASTVEQIILTKPDGLIIGAYDASMTEPINKAIAAGIPVVTFDGDAPTSKRFTFFGGDDYKLGRDYARYMGELLGGKGKVAILTVVAQVNLQDRLRGVQDYIKDNNLGLEIVAIEDNAGDDQITADKTKTIVQAHPDLNGIILLNATGSGVATAMKELGKAGQITVLASDVSDPILEGILDGSIHATSFMNIYIEGYYGIQILYDLANGKLNRIPGFDGKNINPAPMMVDVGFSWITKENAQAFVGKY